MKQYFLLLSIVENENLILNPDCACKLFLDYIRDKCKVNPTGKKFIPSIHESMKAINVFFYSTIAVYRYGYKSGGDV